MLDAYRVLDLSDRAGWLAGRLLADLGAERRGTPFGSSSVRGDIYAASRRRPAG